MESGGFRQSIFATGNSSGYKITNCEIGHGGDTGRINLLIYLGVMARYLAIFFLLLFSLAMAESQEDLYYRALKAEEAGDIARALELFESAVAEPGPYTAEIQEIVDEYHGALGETADDSLASAESPWKFHTFGNVSYIGLRYKRSDVSEAETGSELSSSISASLEYESMVWSHSFEVNASGDWFVDKEDMPSLDTSAWEGSFGVGYSLLGNSLVLDVGANLNVSEDEGWVPDFYAWLEKYFVRIGSQKVGAAFMGYDSFDGPLFVTAYASWHRFVKYGWKSSVYLGARFEADSISTPYWLKWFGPSFKPSFSYRFRTDISVDAKMNLFYGFVVDGPDAEYETVEKFSGSWGLTVSWKPGAFGLFIGAEQFYRYYVLPADYETGYPQSSFYSQLKTGVKWDI